MLSASNMYKNVFLKLLFEYPSASAQDKKKMLLEIFTSGTSPINGADAVSIQRMFESIDREEAKKKEKPSSKGIHNLSKTNNRARCNYQVSPNFTTGYVYVTRGHATERFAIDDEGEWIDLVSDWIMCNLRTQFRYQLKNPP